MKSRTWNAQAIPSRIATAEAVAKRVAAKEASGFEFLSRRYAKRTVVRCISPVSVKVKMAGMNTGSS